MLDLPEEHSDDDDETPDEIPEELRGENLRPVIEAITEAASKIGLYTPTVAVGVDTVGDPQTGEKRHQLICNFVIGDHAFTEAVQNPNAGAEAAILERKQLEAMMRATEMDEIKNSYKRKPPTE